MTFRRLSLVRSSPSAEKGDGFRKARMAEPEISCAEKFVTDVLTYLATLERLRRPEFRMDLTTCDRRAFEDNEISRVFMKAYSAFMESPERFRELKFSQAFRKELHGLYGEAQGEAIFSLWRADTYITAEVSKKDYIVSESGSFPDLFYGGRVVGAENCQEPTNQTIHIAAITGTVELPWIKQIIVRAADSNDILIRARIYLVHDMDGQGPILLIQPRYFGDGIRKDAEELIAIAVNHLRARYERPATEGGAGVEVRLMPNAMTSHDIGVNTGYRTFGSGGSPVFYLDSNCHNWSLHGEVWARNGLYSREPGQSISFPPGWSSEFNLTEQFKPPPK